MKIYDETDLYKSLSSEYLTEDFDDEDSDINEDETDDDYYQASLFDDVLDDEDDADIIDTFRDFTLVQSPEINSDGTYTYKVFDDFGVLMKTLTAKTNAQDLPLSEYMRSNVRNVFLALCRREFDARAEAKRRREARMQSAAAKRNNTPSYFDSIDRSGTSFSRTFTPRNYSYSGFGSGYSYQPKPKSTGFLDKLNKSNVLVIHCADKSTDMLSQIYDGRGWDVLRDGNIDKDELHQLMESHDTIICLGHGTPSGLMNVQGGGLVIGPTEAPYFKNKKIFAIWCNANKYFSQHNIGHGCFITKNVPSDANEARWVGYTVSEEYMLENITYWSKCCADVVDQALSGDAAGAVKKAREAYQAKYGNTDNPNEKGVTDYNTDAIQVQP